MHRPTAIDRPVLLLLLLWLSSKQRERGQKEDTRRFSIFIAVVSVGYEI